MDVAAAIGKCSSKGVIVDTNLLLLYVIGRFDQQRISRFKRTRQFRVADFDLLARILTHFQRCVTTPSVMAEVSNLVSQLGDPARGECFACLSAEIALMDERYEPSATVAQEPAFTRIGLIDAAILRAARGGLFVLSDDFQLINRLTQAGVAAANFNHLRSFV
ncbi:MAG: PIN domain-containing protein [Planctomycetaceae bacterium]